MYPYVIEQELSMKSWEVEKYAKENKIVICDIIIFFHDFAERKFRAYHSPRYRSTVDDNKDARYIAC